MIKCDYKGCDRAAVAKLKANPDHYPKGTGLNREEQVGLDVTGLALIILCGPHTAEMTNYLAAHECLYQIHRYMGEDLSAVDEAIEEYAAKVLDSPAAQVGD